MRQTNSTARNAVSSYIEKKEQKHLNFVQQRVGLNGGMRTLSKSSEKQYTHLTVLIAVRLSRHTEISAENFAVTVVI
jgi:hypothetical protein